MRHARRCSSSVAAILAIAAMLTAAPARGGQTGGEPASPYDFARPPAESGKPLLAVPPLAAQRPAETEPCPRALPCGTRLLGTVRHNGAVELQVPALRW
jgi:hypothetical protein